MPDIPFHVRQGDVLIVAVDRVPDDALPVTRDHGRVVLAYGEVTGHAHAIRAHGAALLERDAVRYLRVDAPVELEHEEHATIELPPGDFKVVIQREYVPAERPGRSWRSVVD
jgi:hypothetical protein